VSGEAQWCAFVVLAGVPSYAEQVHAPEEVVAELAWDIGCNFNKLTLPTTAVDVDVDGDPIEKTRARGKARAKAKQVADSDEEEPEVEEPIHENTAIREIS
jgi:hypothetical protein